MLYRNLTQTDIWRAKEEGHRIAGDVHLQQCTVEIVYRITEYRGFLVDKPLTQGNLWREKWEKRFRTFQPSNL